MKRIRQLGDWVMMFRLSTASASLLAFLSAAAFAMMAFFAKVAYADGMTPSSLLWLRFVGSGILLLGWVTLKATLLEKHRSG